MKGGLFLNIFKTAAIGVLGFLLGALLLFFTVRTGMIVIGKEPAQSLDEQPAAARALLDDAYLALKYIKNEDFSGLSSLAHPQTGVYFVPYSYVDTESDLHFSAEKIKGFLADTDAYLWGRFDGSGDPISLTPSAYFERFVYDADYFNAPVVSVNSIARSGNSIENVSEAFPESQFAEFHFPGFDAEYSGVDWLSLKLVFERFQDEWKLVAVIHSEWTI